MAFQKKARKLASEELFEFAVQSLAVRAFSTADLRWKLRLRAAVPSDVDAVIERLQSAGYLDDKRFAENFASARIANEGFGRLRVLQDLRTRRVAGTLAEEAVEQALEGRSEEELIDAYIERRMPSISAGGPIDDERKLATAWRRLRRAGFSSGAIIAALKRMAARPELLEDPPEEEVELE